MRKNELGRLLKLASLNKKSGIGGLLFRGAMAYPIVSQAGTEIAENLAKAKMGPRGIINPNIVKAAEVSHTYPMAPVPVDRKRPKAFPVKTSEVNNSPGTGPAAPVPHEPHKKFFRSGLSLKDVKAKEDSTEVEKKAYRNVALGKYPMDSYEQVKLACSYYTDNEGAFSPDQRREYCRVMVKRARALKMDNLLSENAVKYASATYAPLPEIRVAMDIRKSAVGENKVASAILDGMMRKIATIPPDVFSAALGEFDRAFGLDQHYDRYVLDPYLSTYGEKTAEDPNTPMSVGAETITKQKILDSGKPGSKILEFIEETFGDDVLKEYRKDPVAIFDSLPTEQKVMIARAINSAA